MTEPTAPPSPRWARYAAAGAVVVLVLSISFAVYAANKDAPATTSAVAATPTTWAPSTSRNFAGRTTTPTATSVSPLTTTTIAPPPPVAPAVYAYEVIGAGVRGASITYTVGSDFNIQQETAARLPWLKEVPYASYMSVSAQGSGGGGTITCRILENGVEIDSSVSSGPYAIASCST